MSATIIPAIGLKRNVANNVGTSLKSRVRYGGINGNGNLMKVNTNATALNILIVIKRLFCCIYNFLLPFILLRKFEQQKHLHLLPSRLYCRLQTLTESRQSKKLIVVVAGLDYCRLGITPYPEDEYINFILNLYYMISFKTQYFCLRLI